MKRSIIPTLTVTLSLLALVGQATASERRSPGLERGYSEVVIEDVEPIGAYAPSSGVAGWNAPLGQGQTAAENPAKAQEMGIQWLLKHQMADGGWGAGSWGTDITNSPSDVATTCYVTLALIRDGSGTQKHRAAIEKSVAFVVNAIDTAPGGSPLLNTPQGTQPQYKLGQYVDTHFAAMLLGEVDGHLSPELNRKVAVSYDKVLDKVQLAQNANGSFESSGWAPILSTSIAAQSLYTAKMNGKDIDAAVLERSDDYQAGLSTGSGSFDASEGAGVELYAVAGGMRGNDQAAKRRKAEGASAGDVAASEAIAASATGRVAADDGRLVAGFGSIGGEEMLSYQMITDTLAENGGAEWDDWNQKMGQYLVNIQNADGSWSGHHCITSTVFTTAGAVMTLGSADYVAVKKKAAGDASANSRG